MNNYSVYDHHRPRFTNTRDSVKDQKKVVDQSGRRVGDSVYEKVNSSDWYRSLDDRQDRADPLAKQISPTGATDSSLFIQQLEYVSVDSADRTKEPHISAEEETTLDSDPLRFVSGSNVVTVTQTSHGLSVGDRVVMNGVKTEAVRLRARLGTQNTLRFTTDSQYASIEYEHGVSSSYTGTTLRVYVSGVVGENGTDMIGNIDVNAINRHHTVYLTKPDELHVPETEFSEQRFYIALPRRFSGSYTASVYNFSIKLNSLAGIPTAQLNAQYPLTAENYSGFHTVTAVTTDTWSFTTPTYALSTVDTGGDGVSVAKVTKLTNGYPDPNHYVVQLPKSITNVVSMRLISSEFPNSIRAFNSSNSYLYWQNLEDGETVHSITITSGNYTASQLETEIQTRTAEVVRRDTGSYTSEHVFSVSIDETTDRVEFVNSKKAVLESPFVAVYPIIHTDPTLDTYDEDAQFELTVYHPSHRLNAGSKITISGAEAYMGIPADTINTVHTILEAEDNDHYTIRLAQTNLSDTREQTRGGSAVTVTTPSSFRLLFDRPNTCGEALGFRDVGKQHAVTPFDTKVTNYDAYDNDITFDELGNSRDITNRSLKLSTDDYFLMRIHNVDTMHTTGSIKTAFAKIQVNGEFNRTMFNSFTSVRQLFPNPIPVLDELNIEFYDKRGELIDFSGLDHSFTLEIAYLIEQPKGSNMPVRLSRFVDQNSYFNTSIS